MVAKVISGKNLRGLIIYNETKVSQGVASCIAAIGFGADAVKLTNAQKLNRFLKLTSLNKNVRTNAVHISLNFAPGEKLPERTLVDISARYMKSIGFGGQPYLVYQHHDAGHPHIHIVSTNIKSDGSRINLHNIGRNQSENARKEIEIAYGLTRAGDQREVKASNRYLSEKIQKAVYGKLQTKHAIEEVVSAVVATYRFTSLAELNAALRHYNVLIDPGAEGSRMQKSGGLLYSIIDDKGKKKGTPIKASALRGKPTLKALEKQFELNKALRGRWRNELRSDIAEVVERQVNARQFAAILGAQQVSVIFRFSKEGKIFGVTFVDHKRRVVFNGSDLGKDFTATALLKKLESAEKPRQDIDRKDKGTDVSQEFQRFPDPFQALVEARGNSNPDVDPHLRKRKRKKRKGKSI